MSRHAGRRVVACTRRSRADAGGDSGSTEQHSRVQSQVVRFGPDGLGIRLPIDRPGVGPSSDEFPTAPDGGWGWVVCIAAFFCMVILDGMMFSFGVLFLELLDYFESGKGRTAMVGSALMGTHLLAGPVTSALVNAWGVRNISMLGSILATGAFACSILSPNITILTILYGFVGGIGVSMIYLPSILAVGFYFEKRRALANGITHSGSGIGTFLYSPLTEYLLGHYGWKGTMLILSGLVLNCVAFCALFRPVDHRKRKRRATPTENADTSPTKGVKGEEESLHLLRNDSIERDIDTAKIPQHSTDTSAHMKNVAQMMLHRENKGTELFSSVPAIMVYSRSTPTSPLIQRRHTPDTIAKSQCNHPSDANIACSHTEVTSSSLTRQRAQSHSKLPIPTSRDHSGSHVPWNMKPMYKKDAFYSGSMSRLPEYKLHQSASLYSIPHGTSHPNIRDGDNDSGVVDSKSCLDCKTGLCSKIREVRPMLRKMTGIGLMSNQMFLLTMLSMVMWTTHSTVLTLLPDCAVLRGASRDRAAFLLSIIGGSNTAARVLAGWVSDRPDVNCLYVNIIALVLGGGACIAMAFTRYFPLLALESTLFGLCMGTWTSLRPIILVEVLGLDNLTNAFGLVAMFQGIAFLVGPPIAGAYFEHVHSYTTPFVIAGVAFLMSAALCTILCLRMRGVCGSATLRVPSDDVTSKASAHLTIDVKLEKDCTPYDG